MAEHPDLFTCPGGMVHNKGLSYLCMGGAQSRRGGPAVCDQTSSF